MNALVEEAKRRFQDCRRQKDYVRADIEEAYFFIAPLRARTASSDGSTTAPDDADMLNVSLGTEVSEDFATTLIASYMPRGQNWIEQSVPETVADTEAGRIKEAADENTRRVFGMVRASNFDAALARSLNPDASVGTHALLIRTPPNGTAPVVCAPVPLRELEIDLGPDGVIWTKFVVQKHKVSMLPVVLRGMTLPKEFRPERGRADRTVSVKWGWWRLADRDVETWQHVVMVDDTLVHEGECVGEGSCELIVARFNPYAEFAFGSGPAIRALPELRYLDNLRVGMVTNIDMSLRPPFHYPDDSFANLENGVEAATGYPVRPGSGNDIGKLFDPSPMDAAYFDADKIERAVRRMFYNDMPQQRGDTPPTATQWVDEMAMAQRKLGTPGESYFREGPLEFFKRFKYLAEKLKVAPEVRGATVVPQNPAKRAQDLQDASAAVRALQLGRALFPEEFTVAVDGRKTFETLAEKMGANGIIAMRSEADVKQAAELIAPLVGGAGGGDVAGQNLQGLLG